MTNLPAKVAARNRTYYIAPNADDFRSLALRPVRSVLGVISYQGNLLVMLVVAVATTAITYWVMEHWVVYPGFAQFLSAMLSLSTVATIVLAVMNTLGLFVIVILAPVLMAGAGQAMTARRFRRISPQFIHLVDLQGVLYRLNGIVIRAPSSYMDALVVAAGTVGSERFNAVYDAAWDEADGLDAELLSALLEVAQEHPDAPVEWLLAMMG